MPPNYKIEDYGRVLKIPNIEVIHRGDYRCTVTRENGQSSSGIIRVPVDGRWRLARRPRRQVQTSQHKVCENRCGLIENAR